MKSIQIAGYRLVGSKFTLAVSLMMGAWFGATTGCFAQPEAVQLHSKWDQELLSIELGRVNINPNGGALIAPEMMFAWKEMTTKYLLRANIYLDAAAESERGGFVFDKEKATGKDVFDAFLAAYPTYTYTCDPVTSVIWFHPKSVRYNDILSEKVLIGRPALQVPMYSGVLEPVLGLLYPSSTAVIGSYWGRGLEAGPRRENPFASWNIPVDLPSGIYCARDIINFCCVSSPNLAFTVEAVGRLWLQPVQLTYANPFVPVRIPAIRFWETEISDTTNTPPSRGALATFMGDASPRKRWAAREYHKAAMGLGEGAASPDLKTDVWELLGFKCAGLVGHGESAFFIKEPKFSGTNRAITMRNLARVDPGLALVTSMELAREQQDPSTMDMVAGHKFTEAEIAVIKPDVYRIARESKLVRDKLIQMKFEAPELSPAGLHELENTNLFILAPPDNNKLN